MKETVEERDAHMRRIPEGQQKWAEQQFETKGFIYYRKHGALVDCFCGKCGHKYIGFWKASEDPFEAACQKLIKPAHNKPGVCERCGYETKYKAAGKIRDRYVNAKGRYAIGQRIGKEEFVFRIFDVEQVMYKDRPVEYDHQEYIRVFLRPGKQAQKDYFVHDWWAGRDRWIDHNLGGMSNIPMPDDAMMTPSTWKAIKNTPMFRYVPSPADKNARDRYFHNKEYPTIRYYEAAAHYPDFEMIVKSGMWRLQNALIWKLGTGYRVKGKTYYDRLGIYKSRVKDLIEAYGAGDKLKAYQIERRAGAHWSDKELEIIAERIQRCSGNEMNMLVKAYRQASPSKVERYIEKIIKKEGCDAFREYVDYLQMRKDRGYDLSNEIILFPRELHRRHNEMVLETENEKMDKRKKEVLEKFPKIAEKYKKLADKYSAAAAGYIIRPAKDAAEIVVEGRYLHHCVGGDMYLGSHNQGKSYILFLRHKDAPDVPFITVEIKGEQINQWYGAYDKKPDQNFFEGWLKTYTGELTKRKSEKKTEEISKTA